jgi:hypothetical protein
MRTFARRSLVLTLLSVVLSKSIANPNSEVVTQGIIDCGQWVEARSVRKAAIFEGYLIGMMNGMALGSTINLWGYQGRNTSREQVSLWMDNYCRTNPLSNITAGVNYLADELTKGKWSKRSEIP